MFNRLNTLLNKNSNRSVASRIICNIIIIRTTSYRLYITILCDFITYFNICHQLKLVLYYQVESEKMLSVKKKNWLRAISCDLQN